MNTKAIAVAIQTKRPVILWGAPGGGKTSWITELARVLNRHLEIVIASIHDPSDFGLPIVVDRQVIYSPAPWARRLVEAGGGILCFDEATTAPPAMQAGLLRVLHEGWVGDTPLPKNTLKILAANPSETTTGTWLFSPPLANRICHLDWDVSTDQWVEGMSFGWDSLYKDLPAIPDDWEAGVPMQRRLIASFIRIRSVLRNAQPEDQEAAGKAWPSGRTWDMAADMRAAGESVGLPETEIQELMAGCVGTAAALEYITWKEKLDLPDPHDMLKNPSKIKLPERDDQLFAALTGMVSCALDKLNETTWNACWQVMERVAKKNKGDLIFLPGKALLDRKGKMVLPDTLVAIAPLLRQAGLLR